MFYCTDLKQTEHMITHILNTNSAFCKGVEKTLCKGHEEKFERINLEFPIDFFCTENFRQNNK